MMMWYVRELWLAVAVLAVLNAGTLIGLICLAVVVARRLPSHPAPPRRE